MEGMEDLNFAHYFPMPSQGNINTITFLQLQNGTFKILVASLKRQIFCFEYLEKSNSTLIPTTKEIPFTYIPTTAEIVTIDAFNKSDTKNDFVIGITIIKNPKEGTMEPYLNIYSEYEDNGDFDIESIAQNCFNVQLHFIPHYHGHTDLVTWKDDDIVRKEPVFILTGSDKEVHMFKEDNTNHTYQEIQNMSEYFPEFYKPPAVVTWLEIQYFQNFSQRISVFGTETGYIRMSKVCVKTKTLLFNHSTDFVSYVSHIKIYQEPSPIRKPACIKDLGKLSRINSDSATFDEDLVLNIIVTITSLPSVIFLDCINHGLDKYKTLRRTDVVSITSCVEVADLDFDGHQEILLGNSRQEILLYKRNVVENEWKIFEVKYVVSPIFRMKYLDLTADGVKELVVFTLKGLYIFQHDAEHLQKKLEEKVKKLLGK